jgi:hypothetical protein
VTVVVSVAATMETGAVGAACKSVLQIPSNVIMFLQSNILSTTSLHIYFTALGFHSKTVPMEENSFSDGREFVL